MKMYAVQTTFPLSTLDFHQILIKLLFSTTKQAILNSSCVALSLTIVSGTNSTSMPTNVENYN